VTEGTRGESSNTELCSAPDNLSVVAGKWELVSSHIRKMYSEDLGLDGRI